MFTVKLHNSLYTPSTSPLLTRETSTPRDYFLADFGMEEKSRVVPTLISSKTRRTRVELVISLKDSSRLQSETSLFSRGTTTRARLLVVRPHDIEDSSPNPIVGGDSTHSLASTYTALWCTLPVRSVQRPGAGQARSTTLYLDRGAAHTCSAKVHNALHTTSGIQYRIQQGPKKAPNVMDGTHTLRQSTCLPMIHNYHHLQAQGGP